MIQVGALGYLLRRHGAGYLEMLRFRLRTHLFHRFRQRRARYLPRPHRCVAVMRALLNYRRAFLGPAAVSHGCPILL